MHAAIENRSKFLWHTLNLDSLHSISRSHTFVNLPRLIYRLECLSGREQCRRSLIGLRGSESCAARLLPASNVSTNPASESRGDSQGQKKALKTNAGDQKWNPSKRLSPDALDGLRSLYTHEPDKHSPQALAEQFKISPEAVRRILKSKWRPSEEEQASRQRRWIRRGERIWSSKVEMGMKPPKKWRVMGIHHGQHHLKGEGKSVREQIPKVLARNGVDIRIPKHSRLPETSGSVKPKKSLSNRIL